jgi:hypothetical protein
MLENSNKAAEILNTATQTDYIENLAHTTLSDPLPQVKISLELGGTSPEDKM